MPAPFSDNRIVANSTTMARIPSNVRDILKSQSTGYTMPLRESTSTDLAKAKTEYLISKVRDAYCEATLVVKGTFDVKVGGYIILTVNCKDGTLHPASGKYFVKEKIDMIEGDFTSTLKLCKESDEITGGR